MQDCISDVKTWMTSNKLKLNDDKTECLHVHCLRQNLSPKQSPNLHSDRRHWYYLGVTLTNNFSMEKHVINTCRSLYTEIKEISNVHHSLAGDATETLLCAFVLSKLDYCNSLLSGSSKHLLDKLQKVQNSAARLVFKACKHEHIKPLLQKLHWLQIVSRIQYEVGTLCYNSFTEIITQSIFLNFWLSTIHPDNFTPFLTPEPSTYLSQKPLDNKLFLSWAQHNGTHYHMMFITQHQHLLSSKP